MTAHTHHVRTPGCYRCELNDDELGIRPDTAAERLAEIQARAEAATPGPWHEEAGNVHVEHGRLATIGGTYVTAVPDAEFIAHAREDVPALVAALRAVLAVHAPNGMPVNRCTEDRLPYHLCPTVAAIELALGGVS